MSKRPLLYLCGNNELRLRLYFANCFAESYNFLESKDTPFLIEIMEKLKYRYFDIHNIDSEFIYMHILLRVCLARENQKFIYTCREKKIEIEPLLLKKINQYFPHITNFNLKNIEILFKEELYVWDSEEEEELISELIEKQVMEFLDRMKIHNSEDMYIGMSQIIINMYLVCKFYDFKPVKLFNRDKYFAHYYKKYNNKVYNVLKNMFAELSQKTGVNISNLLDSIVYWICVFYPEFHYFQFQKRVLVVSDLGIIHCKMIENHIEKRFNTQEEFVKVESICYEHIQEVDFNQYDLIITTLPLFKETKTKCIIVNDNINYEVLYQIKKIIFKNN